MIPHTSHDPGKTKALVFSALVHVLLFLGLFFGVQWKHQPDAGGIAVELWSAPSVADVPPVVPPTPIEDKPEPKPEPKPEIKPEPKPVPKPTPPPPIPTPPVPKPAAVVAPTPPKPEIAVKDKEKEKEKAKPKPAEPISKPVVDKKEPPKDKPKEHKEQKEAKDSKEVAKPVANPPKADSGKTSPRPNMAADLPSVDDELKALKSKVASAKAAQLAAEAEAEQNAAGRKRALAEYAAKIRAKVRGNIGPLPPIQGNPEAVFEVTQLPTGEILPPVKLKRSSGNSNLDALIERAILKSSPLPKPADPALFQRVLDIRYKPHDD